MFQVFIGLYIRKIEEGCPGLETAFNEKEKYENDHDDGSHPPTMRAKYTNN